MKDYYAILGVVPRAEDIVIKAVYKALAQCYRPECNQESAEVESKMQELNEAYQVLSDPTERRAYDQERGAKEQYFDDWSKEEESEDANPDNDPFEKDWQIAVKYYPDLEEINRRLMKTSRMLAFTFRATILETKGYDKRDDYAHHMETEFLKNYFGDDPKLIDFARQVIALKNKLAAKALNDAVRVLGSVSADLIIGKICKDYGILTNEMRERREKYESIRFKPLRFRIEWLLDEIRTSADDALMIELIKILGGRAEKISSHAHRDTYQVNWGGGATTFADYASFSDWYTQNIVPAVAKYLEMIN